MRRVKTGTTLWRQVRLRDGYCGTKTRCIARFRTTYDGSTLKMFEPPHISHLGPVTTWPRISVNFLPSIWHLMFTHQSLQKTLKSVVRPGHGPITQGCIMIHRRHRWLLKRITPVFTTLHPIFDKYWHTRTVHVRLQYITIFHRISPIFATLHPIFD